MEIIKWDGKPISRPGVYSGVDIEIYHTQALCAGPSVSRSGLWRIFDKSEAHFYVDSELNPDRDPEDEESSEALNVGKAAHHLILGEASFRDHFAVRPEEFDSWRTAASKAWREEQEGRGLTVLEPKHLKQIVGMARGLSTHPLVRQGILSGLIEHTMVAQDPATGLWIKCRPDSIPTDSGDYSDLKTTIDISDDGIETAIGRDGLFMQGALVRMVCGLLELPFHSFSFVFTEKKPPHCAQVKGLKPADMDLGDGAIHASLWAFKRASERHVWPGPGSDQTDAAYVEIKPWARKKIEERIQLMEASK